ncbi:hypothetical protein [Thiomicrorhabdus cannonii]|uniref:hypothetical protein n=1 Tax=Thiomicrorhabdus cannonii TaxID=2748011 RepID=UPI0015BEEF6C|nr:hypothetical protein [Thiomicrorhabdus cannonii]
MVKRFSCPFLIALALCWQNALAVDLPEPEGKVELQAAPSPFEESASTGVRITPQKVMLGQNISVLIRGDAAVRDFEKFDLQALKQQFAVYDVTRESSRVRLQLYPLAAGRAKIAAVDIGALHIPETLIEVTPNPQVEVVWQRLPPVLLSGQNAVWSAKVTLHNPAFETHLVAEGQSRLVASEADERLKQQTWVANYQWHAALDNKGMPLQRIAVDSPVLEVKNTSQRTWRFYDAPQRVEIKPLPAFVPITTLVGKVDLTTQTDGLWQVNGALHYWRWQLQANGVQAADLKNLAYRLVAELPHDPAIEWLSASMETSQTLTEQGLLSTVAVRVPYRVNAFGVAHLPELTWRVLESQSGKLIVQTRPAEFILAIPGWLQTLLKLAGLLGLLWLVWQGVSLSRQWWLRRHLQRQIRQAQTPQAIWQAMRHWKTQQAGSAVMFFGEFLKLNRPGAEALAVEDISLAQFAAWFVDTFGESVALPPLLNALNECFYGAAEGEASSSLQDKARRWADELCVRPSVMRVFKRV